MDYCIQININSETFNGNKQYFWCIVDKNMGWSSNMGHGWSSSIKEAAERAEKYYNTIILPKA